MSQLSIAQVGINTTNPDASAILDISSIDKGVLVPRVSLSDVSNTILDGTNVAALGLLIYNTNGGTIGGNGVGFYFFDGTIWKPISQTDKDWLQEGTGLPPQTITDNKYTFGNAVIGKNSVSTDTKFEVENTDTNVSLRLHNTYDVPASETPKYGIFNTLSSVEQQTGISNNIIGNSSSKNGVENLFQGAVALGGLHTGISNRFETIGTANQTGLFNTFASTTSTGTDIYGVRNWFQSTASYTGKICGIVNDMNVNTGLSSNPHYAIKNTFTGNGAQPKYGLSNTFSSNCYYELYGLYNSFQQDYNYMNFGVYNDFTSGLGAGTKYGLRNVFSQTNASPFYGSYTTASGSGGGAHTGHYIDLSSIGLGLKYGVRSVIASLAGGTHYGIYSAVTKAGATNYAGYFLGNVYVSGTFSNPSDRNLKENIQNTTSVIDKIKQVEVKDYLFKKELSEKYGLPKNQQTGFIAQDFQNLFPNLVKDDVLHLGTTEEKPTQEPDMNIKTINYIGMIPILTKAIQEQQNIIEKQQEIIENLENRLKKLEGN